MAYQEPQNMSTLVDIFEYTDSVSDGFFMGGILISLYMVITMYLSGKGESLPDSMVVAGFITSVASVFLLLMGLLNSFYLFLSFMSLILPAIWSYFSKSG